MMEPEDRDRLVRVEVTLEHVQKGLAEHKQDSRERTDELKALIEQVGAKVDAKAFRWSSLVTPATLKTVGYVLLTLASGGGLAAVAKALME